MEYDNMRREISSPLSREGGGIANCQTAEAKPCGENYQELLVNISTFYETESQGS